jgi:hypothetical protein
MFCIECGSGNPEGALFCHKCGRRTVAAEHAAEVRLEGPAERAPIFSASTVSSDDYTALVGVKGWLKFFCIVLTVISPLLMLGQISLNWRETEPYLSTFPNLRTAAVLENCFLLAMMGFSILAGSALWSRKHGAVDLTKKFLVVSLAYSMVSPFLLIALTNLPAEVNNEIVKEGIKGAIRGIVFFTVWFSYLKVSKRVRHTYRE